MTNNLKKDPQAVALKILEIFNKPEGEEVVKKFMGKNPGELMNVLETAALVNPGVTALATVASNPDKYGEFGTNQTDAMIDVQRMVSEVFPVDIPRKKVFSAIQGLMQADDFQLKPPVTRKTIALLLEYVMTVYYSIAPSPKLVGDSFPEIRSIIEANTQKVVVQGESPIRIEFLSAAKGEGMGRGKAPATAMTEA